MISGIHDSLLTAYGVDSRREELFLGCLPHQGSAQAPFKVIFSRVAAHWFPYPLLPAILSGVWEMKAEELITLNWSTICSGSANNAWPGSWSESLEKAIVYVGLKKLVGYNIESSYGLNGWVLAGDISIVTASEI
jgi:hypothetical protein